MKRFLFFFPIFSFLCTFGCFCRCLWTVPLFLYLFQHLISFLHFHSLCMSLCLPLKGCFSFKIPDASTLTWLDNMKGIAKKKREFLTVIITLVEKTVVVVRVTWFIQQRNGIEFSGWLIQESAELEDSCPKNTSLCRVSCNHFCLSSFLPSFIFVLDS